MKILFYLGHPAHFHLFKESIRRLKENRHETIIVIKRKDVLEALLQKEGRLFYNIYPKERKDGKLSIALSLLRRDAEIFKIIRKEKPDIMIGTSSEITHMGKLLGIPSIVANEDDADQVPLFAMLSYPFASFVLAPISCRVGKWKDKTIFYEGYHELSYLHPSLFIPDKTLVPELFHDNKPFFLIRFAKLTAHHDEGKTGLTKDLVESIISRISERGNIFITSEKELDPAFEKYRLPLHPSVIHHALYYADMYIGDSQTMAAEAAVLGTPSLRFNDFVGKLGYLEELEHKYGLTYGIKTSETEKLLQKIDEILAMPDAKKEWAARREKMLSEKINVTDFFVWFIENYPASARIMKEDPNYQYNFKPAPKDLIFTEK